MHRKMFAIRIFDFLLLPEQALASLQMENLQTRGMRAPAEYVQVNPYHSFLCFMDNIWIPLMHLSQSPPSTRHGRRSHHQMRGVGNGQPFPPYNEMKNG